MTFKFFLKFMIFYLCAVTFALLVVNKNKNKMLEIPNYLELKK